jgi:hypothetical protein
LNDHTSALGIPVYLDESRWVPLHGSGRVRQHRVRGRLPEGTIDRDPVDVEVFLVVEDMHSAFSRAVASGCTALAEPE